MVGDIVFYIRSNKKKMTRAERQHHRQRLVYITVAALTAASIGGIALMSICNSQPGGSRYTYTRESDIWYVCNGSVEVAAVEITSTQGADIVPVQTAIQQEQLSLPTIDPTIEPTLEPTLQPTPQPTEEMLIAEDIAF